ncbi:MAG: hypothetical protein QXS37_01550 [Candidatus Aenigmatarchaeota archaeon]
MLLKDYLIAIVVMSIVLFAIAGFVYYFNEQYKDLTNQSIDLKIIESGNKLDELKNKTDPMIGLFSEESITAGGLSVLFEGIGSFFLIILSIATIPFQFIKDIALYIGVPSEIVLGILTILTISISFAIVSAILRKNI